MPKQKVREINNKQRETELRKLGTDPKTLRSCWCADCLNVASLPNCPNKCNGGTGKQKGHPAGYKKDPSIDLIDND